MPVVELRSGAFLDRDGVLNVDHGYVASADRFEWIEGALGAIRFLNDKGYAVVVVTNQAGIARGYYTEEQFLEFTDWMVAEALRHGARIDRVMYCPHHLEAATERYRVDCECRKPKPGMIERAIRELGLRREGSFLIGDMESDIGAANAAGIPGFRFQGGSLLDAAKNAVAEAPLPVE